MGTCLLELYHIRCHHTELVDKWESLDSPLTIPSSSLVSRRYKVILRVNHNSLPVNLIPDKGSSTLRLVSPSTSNIHKPVSPSSSNTLKPVNPNSSNTLKLASHSSSNTLKLVNLFRVILKLHSLNSNSNPLKLVNHNFNSSHLNPVSLFQVANQFRPVNLSSSNSPLNLVSLNKLSRQRAKFIQVNPYNTNNNHRSASLKLVSSNNNPRLVSLANSTIKICNPLSLNKHNSSSSSNSKLKSLNLEARHQSHRNKPVSLSRLM